MNVAVLRTYRGQIEDMLRAELVVVRNALASAREELARRLAQVDDRTVRFLERARAGVTAEEFGEEQAELDGTVESVRRAESHEADLARQWERKLAEVLRATQERRKLDILEARARDDRRRLSEEREQRSLDDYAARRYVSIKDGDDRNDGTT